MNYLLKLFQFLPLVFNTVAQVESDLQNAPGHEKKAAALDALKGAGHIARLADAQDADSIQTATDAAGAAIDAAVNIFKHTGVFQPSDKSQKPAPLSDEEKKQLQVLQARSQAG